MRGFSETDIEKLVTAHAKHTCDHDPSEFCRLCCDHQDLENGHCIDCGADQTEEIFSRAFDRSKDLRKYGH